MSILNTTSDNFSLRLSDIAKVDAWFGVVFDSYNYDPNLKKQLESDLEETIGNLMTHIPSGPQIRRSIYKALGIWVSVRKCDQLVFEKGNQLVKYYEITAPKDCFPEGTPPQSDFRIKSISNPFEITNVHVSIRYNQSAPHSQYKF